MNKKFANTFILCDKKILFLLKSDRIKYEFDKL